MKKKRKLLSSVLSVVLALIIGFAATYSLYYFSVDSYKYSGNKNSLSLEDLGFISSDSSSALSTFIKKDYNFSAEEEQEALKCLKEAKYTELSLAKAFPMYWIVFRSKNFCFEFYNEAADISGEVYIFGKSVYISVTNYNLDGDFPLETVFKAQNINVEKIKELQALHKAEFKQFIRYQNLYSDSPTHDWYESYVVIFIAFSIAALIIIAIVKSLLKKKPKRKKKQ